MDEGKGFKIIININFLNFNDTSYFKKSYRFVYLTPDFLTTFRLVVLQLSLLFPNSTVTK